MPTMWDFIMAKAAAGLSGTQTINGTVVTRKPVIIDNIDAGPYGHNRGNITPDSPPTTNDGYTPPSRIVRSWVCPVPGAMKSLIHFETFRDLVYTDYGGSYPYIVPVDETGRIWNQTDSLDSVYTVPGKWGSAVLRSHTFVAGDSTDIELDVASPDFDFGTGDFCISAQVYLSQSIPLKDFVIYNFSDGFPPFTINGHAAFFDDDRHLQWYYKYNGDWQSIGNIIPTGDNQYHHFAFVRYNGVFMIFMDGDILDYSDVESFAMDYDISYHLCIDYTIEYPG